MFCSSCCFCLLECPGRILIEAHFCSALPAPGGWIRSNAAAILEQGQPTLYHKCDYPHCDSLIAFVHTYEYHSRSRRKNSCICFNYPPHPLIPLSLNFTQNCCSVSPRSASMLCLTAGVQFTSVQSDSRVSFNSFSCPPEVLAEGFHSLGVM